MAISLARNFNGGVTLDDLRTQVGEFISRLEDYLDSQVDFYVIGSRGPEGKKRLPTLKKGDAVFDLTRVPGVITLRLWDGTKFVDFNLANFQGFVNLLTQGNGSGFNPTLYLRSDGNDGWTLDTPTNVDTFEVVATENILARSLITTNGKIGDSNNLTHFNHIVGLVMDATLSGNVATAIVEGKAISNAWSWVNNDKLFLNGTVLSTTPPTSGFSQFIALAKNSETIFVRLQIPILF